MVCLDSDSLLNVEVECINQFCEVNNIELIDIEISWERGFKERIYFFNDGLGGYTIEGIYRSLYD